MKLDIPRHFISVKDDVPFEQKQDVLLGRGAVSQEHRKKFYELYFNHPKCNLGNTDQRTDAPWSTSKMSLKEHLRYKFILSLEGNDVASNLKWIMSSSSIAVLPKPTIESWFMEGKLIGGVHYIEIASDYANLEEVLDFYISQPQLCKEIIYNANAYVKDFFNPQKELLCSLLVLEKYFNLITS